MAMVAATLLIACANLANMLLARATARRREMAVRLSIGAGRSRIVRQLMTESVVLATIAGGVGIALAFWGIRALTLLLANGRENFTLHAELNWHVLAVTLLLSVLTGLLCGLAPALQTTRVNVMPALRETRGRDAEMTLHRLGLRQILIVGQIAFSLLLLVAGGLFGRTLSNLHGIPMGFSRDNLLLFSMNLRGAGYEGLAARQVFNDIRDRLSRLAGVENVSLATSALPASSGSMTPVEIDGLPSPRVPEGQPVPNMAGVFSIGPSFFATMKIPMVAGRDFDERDIGGRPVVIVNEKIGRVLGSTALVGQTVQLRQSRYEIVGVVADTVFFTGFMKEGQQSIVYFPYTAGPRVPLQMTYVLRTRSNPLNHAMAVREAVRDLDPRLAVADLKSEAQHIDQFFNREITLARLSMAFAVLAVVIACVGLYGTVTYNVERRASELGIRMALGASRHSILWLVMRQMLVLALVGLGFGISAVWFGGRYVESFLYGVPPRDPVSILIAIATLLTTGLIAAFVPARRASKIDPLVAVRHD